MLCENSEQNNYNNDYVLCDDNMLILCVYVPCLYEKEYISQTVTHVRWILGCLYCFKNGSILDNDVNIHEKERDNVQWSIFILCETVKR